MNIPTTLIIEAIAGLKSFGGAATSVTVAKLEMAINNNPEYENSKDIPLMFQSYESKAQHTQLPTLDSLKAEVKRAGYTPSAASWEDGYAIHAFSVESASGTNGHPLFEASYSKATGWLRVGNKASSTFLGL